MRPHVLFFQWNKTFFQNLHPNPRSDRMKWLWKKSHLGIIHFIQRKLHIYFADWKFRLWPPSWLKLENSSDPFNMALFKKTPPCDYWALPRVQMSWKDQSLKWVEFHPRDSSPFLQNFDIMGTDPWSLSGHSSGWASVDCEFGVSRSRLDLYKVPLLAKTSSIEPCTSRGTWRWAGLFWIWVKWCK